MHSYIFTMTGETKEQDLPFDVALLMELLSWFKYKFFSWVDRPPCDMCGGPTVLENTVTAVAEQETCRIEVTINNAINHEQNLCVLIHNMACHIYQHKAPSKK